MIGGGGKKKSRNMGQKNEQKIGEENDRLFVKKKSGL